MIRAWVEDFGFAELQRPAVVRLIAEHGISPHIAVRPHELGEPLATAIRAITAAGAKVGVWPLLRESDGYWASERNVDRFAKFVEEVARWLRENALSVATFAIDIEPAIDVVRGILDGGAFRRALSAVRAGYKNRSPARLRAATDAFTRVQAYLTLRGFETIVAAIPLAAFDHGAASPIAEEILVAPIIDVPWDRISWMTYTSMIAGYFAPTLDRADARALLYLVLRHAYAVDPVRTAASVGVTSTGRLRDEEPYRSSTELALDVAAARAVGVNDIAVYSLEGILARQEPERWLAALAAPAEVPRITLRARAVFHALRRTTRAVAVLASV